MIGYHALVGGDYEGSYVYSSKNIYPDITNNLTMFFFGFTKKLSEINQLTTIDAEVALSGPFGQENNLLMFTDGLVISKKIGRAVEMKRRLPSKFHFIFCQGRTVQENHARSRLDSKPKAIPPSSKHCCLFL